jgi:hypothetical protein
LWYGLLAPPLVWAAELYLNYGLASHACFPGQAPRASFISGWDRVWVALLVVNLVCLAVAAIGLVTSAFSWRRLRDEQPVEGEAGRIAYPPGERLKSFAVSGLMVSGLFTVTILFNTLYLWSISTCSLV